MELTWKSALRGVAVSLGLGALFAFFGVYDTGQLPFFERFVFWSATMITGMMSTLLVAPWALNGPLKDRHALVQIGVVAAVISVPITFVLALFDSRLGLGTPLLHWAVQYVAVLVISLVIISVGYLWVFARAGTGGGDSQPAEAFLERLPIKYRGASLYAVSSEDHYLRVHTDLGEELILMRLADAVRELNGADGLQTHRSWWVATDGVADVERDNGKTALVLKSGAKAPVSRSYTKKVREAGLY